MAVNLGARDFYLFWFFVGHFWPILALFLVFCPTQQLRESHTSPESPVLAAIVFR